MLSSAGLRSKQNMFRSLVAAKTVLNKTCKRCLGSKTGSTIFALSSGMGRSAVAVVRVSGPKSREVMQKIARVKEEGLLPRKAVLRDLIDPISGEPLDRGLVLWFPGPKSFTGEDSVELHIHGGIAVISSVISALQKLPGFRMAEPGEFTKRAFLAGKMDATEVEGLADLLRAETETQRRQALRQAGGELALLYNKWRASILQYMAQLEAFIDFGEDQDIGNEIMDTLRKSVGVLMGKISNHLNDNRRGERLRNGVQVAIIGEPNVGKSSLLNILSRKNVAIVSPHAGTTRDILEISLDVGGYPIVLCDTAGLRHSDDPVEGEGVRRAKQAASMADLVVMVVDASTLAISFLTKTNIDQLVHDECQRLDFQIGEDTDYLVVINKSDLVDGQDWQESPSITAMSCKTEQGLDSFLARLQSKLAQLCASPLEESPLITSTRQRHHLQNAFDNLSNFIEMIDHNGDLALAGEQLRKAARQIGHITTSGRIGTEEMLDVLFGSFCIGK